MDELLQPRFLAALNQADPLAGLREAVVELRREGRSANDLRAALEEIRADLDETDEDIVLEVLDFLTGWCSPEMRIE